MAMAAPQRRPAGEPAPRLAMGLQTFVVMLAFVGVLSSLGVYQVWTRHRVYNMSQELSTETLRYRSLLEEGRKLRLELATLKRVERIRKEASERLGMRVPAPQDIIEIR